MLGMHALCTLFATVLSISSFAQGAAVAKDTPVADSSKANTAWQLLKESLQETAPLLHSLKSKSSASLRGNRDVDDDMSAAEQLDLDAASLQSDADDAVIADLEASEAEAAAIAKEDADAIDAAVEGKEDKRPRRDDEASRFEHSVTDLILGMGKGGGGMNATPMGDSVRQMKELITRTMLNKVKQAHSNNQNALDRLSREIGDCGGVKESQLRIAGTQERKYKDGSPVHKECRLSEAALATERNECNEQRKQLLTMAKITCKTFENVERTVANQVMNSAMVKKAASERPETYIRRLESTICGKGAGGNGGGSKRGYLDRFLSAKERCDKTSKMYKDKKKECVRYDRKYKNKKIACDIAQAHMDNSACTWAIGVKDACESYVGCYQSTKGSYLTMERVAKKEEKDRKAEWRGLKRMQCLINAFSDGKVKDSEVTTCKKKKHDTSHLDLKFAKLPPLAACDVPRLYPATPAYKRAEFAPLPALAKGQVDANQCSGVEEVSTRPRKGSPRGCKCTRMALLGSYSAGPLIKCTDCLDVSRSQERNSCPLGTKLFSPRSRRDWQVVQDSCGALRAPHWIVDITKPKNGCGGCKKTMNSRNRYVSDWETADDSPWWLRSRGHSEPNGDYTANCYLNVNKFNDAGKITFNDGRCGYHSKSYYCQLKAVSTKPKKGSPKSCVCSKVSLTGKFSAGSLVKCVDCWDTRRSRDKNSCPKGMKIFSPASRQDWKVVLSSIGPLRAPNWIVDVTRPQNGCGGCTRSPMKSEEPRQTTWRSSDGSPWWLRSSRYTEPNGDYQANCYLDLWKTPHSEDDITFNDGKCNYHSRSYYCQPARERER